MKTVLRHLRRTALLRDGGGLSDAHLLECFMSGKDDAAFEAIVRRHGTMVLGVCRRLLHSHHDAEDAFQATFLVLAQKAASIRPPGMLANWLYGVAYYTARRARAVRARRLSKEKQLMDIPEPTAKDADSWFELLPVLDEELSHLPAKYRAPILLCDLQGKTHHEAARELGWPEGSLAGRLARARPMLVKRLARRGIALGAGSVALVLSRSAALASVPTRLFVTVVHAGKLLAAGQPLSAVGVCSHVTCLVHGVLRTMVLTKLKNVALWTFLLSFLLAAGGQLVLRAAGAEDQRRPARNTSASSPAGRPIDREKKTLTLGNLIVEDVDPERATLTTVPGAFKVAGTFQAPGRQGPKAENEFVPAKPTRLANLRVARDARIEKRGTKLKLADLKAGMHVALKLSVVQDNLMVVAISVKD